MSKRIGRRRSLPLTVSTLKRKEVHITRNGKEKITTYLQAALCRALMMSERVGRRRSLSLTMSTMKRKEVHLSIKGKEKST
jgi:hypothetical protein